VARTGDASKTVAARRCEPGVEALPERGVRRQGQQQRRVPEHAVQHGDRLVRVDHPDVHVQPEDHQAARDPTLARHQHLVALAGRDLAVGIPSERMRAAGCDVDPDLVRGAREARERGLQVVPRVLGARADLGRDLHHLLEDLGLDALALAAERPEDRRCHRGQVAGLAVDELQLPFDSEREAPRGRERQPGSWVHAGSPRRCVGHRVSAIVAPVPNERPRPRAARAGTRRAPVAPAIRGKTRRRTPRLLA
jgi:hypothetical protein